jgi:endogenous inhibitor of DNA gyrase (YacG/DUF329 family)
MTSLQKDRISILRASGDSYNSIADALGLSVNTVKSYCRRNNLTCNTSAVTPKVSVSQVFCKQCGNELPQIPNKKPLKFCSNECRVKWWNTHPDKVNKKAIYSFSCAHCKKAFTAYGNSNRKYCSHECYINDRFKGGALV